MYGTGSVLGNISQRWRYALVGGVIALPFTAFGYWQTGSELSFSPVLVGGILAGYLAEGRLRENRGVGIRTGLVGGLPVFWVLFDMYAALSGFSGPSWFVASDTTLVVGFLLAIGVIAFGIAALVGEVGVKVGSWIARKQTGQRTPAVEL